MVGDNVERDIRPALDTGIFEMLLEECKRILIGSEASELCYRGDARAVLCG
jgi:hypothetical protein